MKTVTEMAIEAGADDLCIRYSEVFLKEFAALVREDEREKQQEPVAWRAFNKAQSCYEYGKEPEDTQNQYTLPAQPLYTTPPTAAQAARQIRDALEMIATYKEEDGQCDNGYSPSYVAKQAIAALPIPGEEK